MSPVKKTETRTRLQFKLLCGGKRHESSESLALALFLADLGAQIACFGAEFLRILLESDELLSPKVGFRHQEV